MKIFADDTNIFHRMFSRDDHHQIQADYDFKWLEEWQLGFNEGKCKVLHLDNNNPKMDYKMNGVSLVTDTLEKDLGVAIDVELKFHSHIANAAIKPCESDVHMLGRSHSAKTVLCHGQTTPGVW